MEELGSSPPDCPLVFSGWHMVNDTLANLKTRGVGRGEGSEEEARKTNLITGKFSVSLNLYNTQMGYFQEFTDKANKLLQRGLQGTCLDKRARGTGCFE